MIAQSLSHAWSLVARWYSIPLLLLVWQVAVGSGLVESRLLPSPGRVWTAPMRRAPIRIGWNGSRATRRRSSSSGRKGFPQSSPTVRLSGGR